MGMKDWPHKRGRLRALLFAMGPHWIACHGCERFRRLGLTAATKDRPFDPCPFVCSRCGRRAAIVGDIKQCSGYELIE